MPTGKLLTGKTSHRSYLEELDISGGGAGRLGRDFGLLLLLLPLIGVGVDSAGPALFLRVGLAGSLGIDGVDDDDDGGADGGGAAAGESPPAGVANSCSL